MEEPAQSVPSEPISDHIKSVPNPETETQIENDEQDTEPRILESATYRRPKRAAALKARERVKQWTCEDNY